jgi:hypothetical protein
MRRILVAILLGAVVGTTAASAQNKAFGAGQTDLGPTLGLGGIGAAGMSFGGRFERGIKALPNLGDGTLSFGLSVDYWSYNETFVAVDYSFRYIPIGATVNYHINTKNEKIDPFVGAGLGYSIVSTSFTGAFSSGIYFIGRLGMRYFLKPALALYGDVGAGASTLNVGLMFKLAGAQ